MNAIYCIDKKQCIHENISWNGSISAKNAKMKLLEIGKYVKWKVSGNKVTVRLAKNISVNAIALALQYQYK